MFDCSKEVLKFHDEAVSLPQAIQDKLRENRTANQKRLKDGLEAAKNPKPLRFIKQGSYAMKTMIQRPLNDFDIDDGVLFNKEDLKGSQGADKTPLDARKMVCDALQDKVFNKKPEVRDKCVRVYYNEGHHVDIPVYRTEAPNSDDTLYELAAAEWSESNPEGVTRWFDDCLKGKTSQDEGHQMRRMVRFLKAFGVSRPSWNMPSGFIKTVLVNESFTSFDNREDRAFYNLIQMIKARLDRNLVVKHPVLDETLTNTSSDPKMVELKNRLDWALSELKITSDPNCTRKAALKAWKSVFNTDFFDTTIEEESNKKSFAITHNEPLSPVDKRGGGRFG